MNILIANKSLFEYLQKINTITSKKGLYLFIWLYLWGDLMRIAIFTDTFVPDVNGVAITLKHFTDYLDEKGHEYIVFAPKSSKDTRFSSQVHRFKSLPLFFYPECRLALPNMLRVKQALLEFQPDIIHIATEFNVGLCGLHYAKKLNIPLVGSYHTNFDKYLEYYDIQFLSKVLWKYMRWFHKPFRKIFVPSYDTIESLRKKGFTNLHIWPGGVDCELFNPYYSQDLIREKYNIKEKYILSFVSRLAPEKDIGTLLKIAKQLPEDMKENVRWLVVGDGPAKDEMMAEAPSNMTFTGFLSGKDLAAVYSVSDLFVFPSATETFGNVVIEALASGTPVIGAKSGGVKNLVKHEVNGILCEPKQVDSFISAIQKLINDDELRKTMSKQARDFALTQTWEAIFDRLLLDYEDAINVQKYNPLLA